MDALTLRLDAKKNTLRKNSRMKQCKDCKWWKRYIFAWWYRHPPKWFFGECDLWLHDRKPICLTPEKELYERKRWLFWAWWIPKLLLLALLLAGCVHVRHGEFEYWRLGEQQIGEALLTLPDGSELLLDGQKSELPKVEITLPATSITIGKKEVQP